MMVPMASAGYDDHLKKVFSFKIRHSKVASFTYSDSVNGPTAYLR